MIDKSKFNEYKETLLNVSRLTNKENSVLISFNVDGDECHNVVSFIQQDGTKDVLKDSYFICDDDFYKDFLEKFIIDYCANMVIAFSDRIDMNGDSKYTYRIITDDNDMLTIDGISLDYANYLMDISKKKNDSIVEDIYVNEDGVTTAIASAILVVGIGLSLLAMVLLCG